MNWDDTRVFLAVAREESISRAGKGLKMDPATVARRSSRLEEALGAPLFLKSPQGYALTDEGERLLAHATRAEQALHLGEEELRGQAGLLTGTIRLGAPDGSANYLLPQVCAKICDENPGLEVEIVALPRVFNLSKREADMAVTVSPPDTGRLLVQKLSDYHLHLATTETYLAEHHEITQLSDLKDHRLIGYIPDMIFDKELDYLADMQAEKVHLSSNSFSVQFNFMRQGAGVAVVHDFAIPASDVPIRRVLTDQLSLTRSFYLVRHADERRVERLNRFSAALAREIRREVARLEGLCEPQA